MLHVDLLDAVVVEQTEVVDRFVYTIFDLLIIKVDLDYWFPECSEAVINELLSCCNGHVLSN